MSIFSNALCALMDAKKDFTIPLWAEFMFVSEETIQSWRNGKEFPKSSDLNKIIVCVQGEKVSLEAKNALSSFYEMADHRIREVIGDPTLLPAKKQRQTVGDYLIREYFSGIEFGLSEIPARNKHLAVALIIQMLRGLKERG